MCISITSPDVAGLEHRLTINIRSDLHELEETIGALYVTDSRLDRESLIRVKGSRTNGTCEWIRDNAVFRSWLGRIGQELRRVRTHHEEDSRDDQDRNSEHSDERSDDDIDSTHENTNEIFEDAVSELPEPSTDAQTPPEDGVSKLPEPSAEIQETPKEAVSPMLETSTDNQESPVKDTSPEKENSTADHDGTDPDQQESSPNLDEGPASDFMWISGGPGKGKTMLSIFLTQELDAVKQQSDGEADAIYFFCSSSYRSRNSATAVLKSLISQMIWDHPSLVRHLVFSTFKPLARRGTAEMHVINRGALEKSQVNLESLDSLWQIFRNIILDPEMPRVYCLIDGLDECDSESSVFLARKFVEFSNTDHGQLKLAIVSRPENPLLTKFPTIELTERLVADDLEKFISSKVDELSHVDGFNERFRDNVREELLKRSEGTFLWVGFVINNILVKKNCTEILDALEGMPPGLDPIYSRMLTSIDEHHHDRVSRILLWVTMVERSLTLDELAAVIGVQSRPNIPKGQAMRDYVALCGLFLEVRGQEVALVHKSAKDYLLQPKPHEDPILEKFRIKPQDAHYKLARFCFDHVQNSHLQHPSPRVGYDAPSKGSSILHYAILYWAYHAKESGENADKLFHSASPFFKAKYILRKNWAGAYAHETGAKSFKLDSLLHLSAYFGIVPWIHRLLRKGEKSNPKQLSEKDQESRFPLHVATLQGHAEAVEVMLERGAVVDARTPLKETSLMLAASNGHVDTIWKLLHYHVNANASNVSYFTPLMRAAFQGKLESVEALIGEGANLEAKDYWGQTALIQTSGWGKGDPEGVAAALLKAGAKPDSKDNTGDTALIECAALRYREEDLSIRLVKLLLEHGANPNIANIGNVTVLIYAARRGLDDIVQLLLEHKANPDTQELAKETALFVAAEEGRKRSVELLLEHNASKELADGMDQTPLLVAARHNYKDIVKLLLDHDDWIEHQDKFGCTALMIAAFKGQQEVVQVLIDYGAVVEARNGVGETALIGAIHRRHTEISEMLLKAGADANTRTANGNTALIKAARHAADKIVELLLDHGADINAQNTQIDKPALTTAIHQAAWCGKMETVELLSKRGADKNNVGKAYFKSLYEKSKKPFSTDDYETYLSRRMWKTEFGAGLELVGKIPFRQIPVKSIGHEFFKGSYAATD